MENVLYYFKEICKIPRETYHVEKIANYLETFAKKRSLDCIRDKYNNVLIVKEASSGCSNYQSIILQAHTDMVCQKKEEVNHDFSKDPIEVIEENGFLSANNTTLGADDGIGMAIILALLDSNEKLGKIEALFTADEEVGMDGALNFDISLLTSNYLINLDSEEEGVLTAACAGGISLEVNLPIKRKEKIGKILNITINNLKGGHSGVDINKKRVNAITFLGKNLVKEKCQLIDITGGKVDNAIPDNATITIKVDDSFNTKELIERIKVKLKESGEIKGQIKVEEKESLENVIINSSRYLNYISSIPNGVISYEKSLDSMVRTSTNLGRIKTNDNEIIIKHLIRSSNIQEQRELVNTIKKEAAKLSGTVKELASYPTWEYNEESKLRILMEKIYEEDAKRKLEIQVIHAGLECGILKSKMPSLDCVSIGPNVYDVHTPNERVEIASIERTYNYVLKIIKNISKLESMTNEN